MVVAPRRPRKSEACAHRPSKIPGTRAVRVAERPILTSALTPYPRAGRKAGPKKRFWARGGRSGSPGHISDRAASRAEARSPARGPCGDIPLRGKPFDLAPGVASGGRGYGMRRSAQAAQRRRGRDRGMESPDPSDDKNRQARRRAMIRGSGWAAIISVRAFSARPFHFGWDTEDDRHHVVPALTPCAVRTLAVGGHGCTSLH
jgi:hypothetical protein